MYEQFFNLNKSPFSLTPNTQFFLQSRTHKDALDLLTFAIKNREGFIKVSGEVGTGKTMLCRVFLNAIEEEYKVAYIPNPCLSAEALYNTVLKELAAQGGRPSKTKGNDSEESNSRQALALEEINKKLINYAKRGKPVVLIIDEAQAMPSDTLEALRLLTNLETESNKLLQVVLFGQPELDRVLNQEHLRQLKQRITFEHKLSPLNRGDIENYVAHRVLTAGYHNKHILFSHRAMSLIEKASNGIPRLINILCHKAMLDAYGNRDDIISARHVRAAIQDTSSVNSSFNAKIFYWLSAMLGKFSETGRRLNTA